MRIMNMKLSSNVGSIVRSRAQKCTEILANSINDLPPVEIRVKREFLTKYLALEYGVAGQADSEKADFGEKTIAKGPVLILPKTYKHLRWFARGVLYSSSISYYYGIRKYKGRGIIRPLLRNTRTEMIRIAEGTLKRRFKTSWERIVTNYKKHLKYDANLRKFYVEVVNLVSRRIFLDIIKRTPLDKERTISGSKRDAQIVRWNALWNPVGIRRRTLRHLKESGYTISYIRE